MRKKLVNSLLTSLIFFTPLKKTYSFGEVYKLPLDGIPKKFQDYKKGIQLKEREIFFKGIPYKILEYDVEGNLMGDVVEFYKLNSYEFGIKIYAKNPCMYGFDLDNNLEYSDDEFLMDEAEDGLNNNEYWTMGGLGFA